MVEEVMLRRKRENLDVFTIREKMLAGDYRVNQGKMIDPLRYSVTV